MERFLTVIRVDHRNGSLSMRGRGLRYVPPCVYGDTSLRALDLGDNRLSDTPVGLTGLVWLALDHNLIVGLSATCALPALQLLDLAANGLTDAAVGQFPLLRVLELGGNRLVRVPRDVLGLRHLEVLGLGHNFITQFPADLGSLTALRSLELNDNLTNSIPTEIGTIPPLRFLSVAGNPLVTIPYSIACKDMILHVYGRDFCLPIEALLLPLPLDPGGWNPLRHHRFPAPVRAAIRCFILCMVRRLCLPVELIRCTLDYLWAFAYTIAPYVDQ
eukprot:TRINITY_DN1025_c0_g1_i1.p1 TRINITY_DN1025_c0_g1~~TRINITY_DN1025_c0_g1_i1.p1  ORF type:complete len:273 (-),score=8.23 TRINITY_DN1025_c0_g1_i1:169-987(-)